MTGMGERGKHGFRVCGGATAGAHVARLRSGARGATTIARGDHSCAGGAGPGRQKWLASLLGWTRRGWVGWGFRLLLEALGSQYIYSLYIYIHIYTYIYVCVRHGYPWVPTDQAHGRPRQVGPAY
jgi:hypothetical protein